MAVVFLKIVYNIYALLFNSVITKRNAPVGGPFDIFISGTPANAGVVSTVAGNGTPGFADGNATSAQFNSPAGVTLDSSGNIYVADYNNQRIRKISN